VTTLICHKALGVCFLKQFALLCSIFFAIGANAATHVKALNPACAALVLMTRSEFMNSPTLPHEATGKFMQYIKMAFTENPWLTIDDLKFFAGFVKVANPFEVFSSRIPSPYQEMFKSGVDEFIHDVDWGLAVEEIKKIINEREKELGLKTHAHEEAKIVTAYIPVLTKRFDNMESWRTGNSDQRSFIFTLANGHTSANDPLTEFYLFGRGIKIDNQVFRGQQVEHVYSNGEKFHLLADTTNGIVTTVYNSQTGKYEGFLIGAPHSRLTGFVRQKDGSLSAAYESKDGTTVIYVPDLLKQPDAQFIDLPKNILDPKIEKYQKSFFRGPEGHMLVAFVYRRPRFLAGFFNTYGIYVLDLTEGGKPIYHKEDSQEFIIKDGITTPDGKVYLQLQKSGEKDFYFLNSDMGIPYKKRLKKSPGRFQANSINGNYLLPLLLDKEGDIIFAYGSTTDQFNIVNVTKNTEVKFSGNEFKEFYVTSGQWVPNTTGRALYVMHSDHKLLIADIFKNEHRFFDLSYYGIDVSRGFYGAYETADGRILAYFEGRDDTGELMKPIEIQLYGPVDLSKVKAP
jgi:hypothetical protein